MHSMRFLRDSKFPAIHLSIISDGAHTALQVLRYLLYADFPALSVNVFVFSIGDMI